jgi:hypothetical protein
VGDEGAIAVWCGEKVIGFVGGEGRSLFDFEGIGDHFLWVVRGDRYLMR